MKHLNLLSVTSLAEVKAESSKRSFYYFFKEFWETVEAVEYVDNWHIEFICNELQKVYEAWDRGESQNDMYINVPPGTSKSTICAQLFPVWIWIRNPSIRVINSSYSSDLSTAHAVKSRNCIASDKFKLYFSNDWQIKPGEDNKTWYKNSKMGERFATSTGGGVTGMHADFIIVDDPVNPKQAESAVQRETAVRHIKETLSTRKTNKNRTVMIVIMQRLHEQDPTGIALKEKPDKINHICLPGELSDNVHPESCRQHYQDGLMDAKRLNRAALDSLKTDLGSYGYSGQINQKPSPEGGGQIKKTWFRKCSAEEFLAIKQPVNIFLDTAYTKDQKNDPTSLMSTKYQNEWLYISNSVQVWQEFPELLKYIPKFADSNGYSRESRIMVEPKASGKSIVQSLKKSGLNIIELDPPVDDKVTRVAAVAAMIEAGRVVLVDSAWNDNFLGECAAFPKGQHDDQVDNMVNALNFYTKNYRIRSTF